VAWDWLVAGLAPIAGVQRAIETMTRDTYHDLGFHLMTQLVEKQLRNRQSVVLDCVARPRALAWWTEVAREHRAPMFVIECVCSDVDVHRSRVVGRTRRIPGWYELEWSHVERSRTGYEPLPGEKLVVDAVDPFEHNRARVRAYVDLGQDGNDAEEAR